MISCIFNILIFCTILLFVNANCGKKHRSKVDIPNTKIHDRSLFWIDTDTSIKTVVVKLIYRHKPPLLVKRCVHVSVVCIGVKCQCAHITG